MGGFSLDDAEHTLKTSAVVGGWRYGLELLGGTAEPRVM